MIIEKTYCVYITCNRPNGAIYIGFTGDIERRAFQHKDRSIAGFTKKYWVGILVYYEFFGDPSLGIQREKQMKKWRRSWKIALIEKHNPEWKELYMEGVLLPMPLKEDSR